MPAGRGAGVFIAVGARIVEGANEALAHTGKYAGPEFNAVLRGSFEVVKRRQNEVSRVEGADAVQFARKVLSRPIQHSNSDSNYCRCSPFAQELHLLPRWSTLALLKSIKLVGGGGGAVFGLGGWCLLWPRGLGCVAGACGSA